MCSVIRLPDQWGIGVDPAFELVRAGPSTRPLVLADDDRPRARDAADRRVALVVQRVVGNLVDVDVCLEALGVPVDERMDLPDAVALRPLDALRVRARECLLSADAGDPGVVRRERPLERRDLAEVATAVGVTLPQVRPLPNCLLRN